MNKRQYRWTVAPKPDEELTARLGKEINVSETLAKVLISRGVITYELAKEFFRPQLSYLHDPFRLDGMEKAVQRILAGVQTHEQVMVFGDYDVDGTNSAAMLTLCFREIGLEAFFYIPDRIKEGYGVSKLGIDRAHASGVTLLVTIDCGITAVTQVEYARSLGIDVI